MASVIGTQTNENTKEKVLVLRGTAKLVHGDDTLSVPITLEEQAPAGKELAVTWTVVLRRVN